MCVNGEDCYLMYCFAVPPAAATCGQRQTVFLVPVHMVTARWKERQFCYWVFGYDHSVHCTEYPGSKCDCDCTLL